MFGIGGFELFIILIFGFLIFGPDKLPEIAKTVGKGIARFREAQQEVNDAIGDEKIIDLDNPDEPFKNPVEALDRIAKRQEEKKAAASASKAPASAARAGSGSPAKDGASSPAGGDEPKQESFTERKARYERERAARKAAEAAKAKEGGEDPVGAQTSAPVAGSSESATDVVSIADDGATTDAPSAETPVEGGDA